MAAGSRARTGRLVGSGLLALVGVAVAVWAWRFGGTPLYVGGLLATAIGVVVALRGRRREQVVAALVLAVVGVGGPWLGIRLAYAPTGVDVPPLVGGSAEYVGSVGDEGVLLVSGSALVAVGADGTLLTSTSLGDVRRVWPVTGEGAVALGDGVLVGLAPDGRQTWTRSVATEDEPVAGTEGVVVLRSCGAPEDDVVPCTWTGIDVADGVEAWEVTGEWDPSSPAPGPAPTRYLVQPALVPAFVARDDAGTRRVYDAGSGQELRALPDDERVTVLAGDDVLMVAADGGSCSVTLVRDGSTGPESPFACDLWRGQPGSSPGVLVGGSFWATPTEAAGTLVVDLTDGTARTEGYSYGSGWYPYGSPAADGEPVHVLGAGVDARVDDDGVAVLDPASGETLWQVTVRSEDIRSLQLGGEVLVLSRYPRPLLLHEWFAPSDDGVAVTEVYDARTGERLAALRTGTGSTSPVVTGRHVIVDAVDQDGSSTRRLVGG